jgi:hypothetical protein
LAKNWVAGAVKRPGALTAKAKRAGKSVSAYCASLGPNADTRTKRQCALYHTLRRMSKKRGKVLVPVKLIQELVKILEES